MVLLQPDFLGNLRAIIIAQADRVDYRFSFQQGEEVWVNEPWRLNFAPQIAVDKLDSLEDHILLSSTTHFMAA